MDWKNKSLLQHIELTNVASFKNDESTAVESINKNQPTVLKPVCLSNKTFHSSARTETVDLHLNTTRQYLHLVKNQQFTKMYASQLLSESLGKEHAILPKLPHSVRKIVPVTYDETPFYANDGMYKVWGSKNESMLRNKSQGLSMHVSDFICQSIGCLKLSEYDRHINDLLPDDSILNLNIPKPVLLSIQVQIGMVDGHVMTLLIK
ncbi:333_t:CDS:2 [Cetraspora pellucida]|uniref:333_t:CDS:1 n=1 Tax=Cetraspora pellucida TaxID=1433469 RepID=A0A9N9NKK7_9GLOM|nr:333_t:CDS:2 [Cetraspora pellucida]